MNEIGLDSAKTKQLTDKLNVLLADYQLFYINARGFHWNIAGEKFFELHAKFEELYNDAFMKIDEVAERILTLGHTPQHNYSEYLQVSSIEEAIETKDGDKAVSAILAGFNTLLTLEREIHAMAGEAGDEGTGSLMSDYIRQQEKSVWMYSAYQR